MIAAMTTAMIVTKVPLSLCWFLTFILVLEEVVIILCSSSSSSVCVCVSVSLMFSVQEGASSHAYIGEGIVLVIHGDDDPVGETTNQH